MQAYSVSSTVLAYVADMAMGRPSKTKRTEFGERLFATRLERGLSQKQIAEQLGITQQSYAGWERRETALKPDHLVKLAEILSVPVDYLLGNTTARQRTSGPAGKLRQVFERANKLPRTQQAKVAEFVEAFVERQEKAS